MKNLKKMVMWQCKHYCMMSKLSLHRPSCLAMAPEMDEIKKPRLCMPNSYFSMIFGLMISLEISAGVDSNSQNTILCLSI